MDVIATQYIDESLVNAMDATSINSIQAGDYRWAYTYISNYWCLSMLFGAGTNSDRLAAV